MANQQRVAQMQRFGMLVLMCATLGVLIPLASATPSATRAKAAFQVRTV